MSMLPATRAILKDNLSPVEKAETYDQIKNLKGVLSASFNDGAKSIVITYRTGQNVQENLLKIKGVARLAPQF